MERPKRDWKNPKVCQKKLKPLPDWMMKPKSDGPPWQMSEEARERVLRDCYKGAHDYLNQSPYDATPPSLVPKLFGGSHVVPFDITDQDRPILQKLSHLALDEYYNNNINNEGSGSGSGGASFEFHDLVKCTRWSDHRRRRSNAFADHPLDPTEYYITFQAKPKGGEDTSSSSSSPAITIFQAKVLVDKDDQDKPPVVEECRIKI